jgi:hypothetical protein
MENETHGSTGGMVSTIRLREPAGTAADGAVPAPVVPLTPLRVSGVVVGKADVVDALRVYVPALVDIQVTEDGGFFWLLLDEEGAGAA